MNWFIFLQFGGRLENVEDLIQTLFGHEGTAGGTVSDWAASLLHKLREVFTSASKDFVETHQRDKRSYDVNDVKALLAKVGGKLAIVAHPGDMGKANE